MSIADKSKMSYLNSDHDLFITTPTLERTSIFDLPFNVMVTCTRTGGWELWQVPDSGIKDAKLLAGEYEGEDKWLLLDVAGRVIVDSREEEASTMKNEEPTAALDIFERDRNILKRIDRPGNTEFDT